MSSFPIIDSHIHLYAASHISKLSWTPDSSSDHIFNRQNSVDQYREATGEPTHLRGFVFLEADRKSGLGEEEWQDVLDEVRFLLRIADGNPVKGEGYNSGDKSLVLAIIPWAPVPAGAVALEKYMKEVMTLDNASTEALKRVRGVRYLLQDKPPGTMLQQPFVESLNWLGDNNLTFDLGVDARSGGLHQLCEACEMLERARDSGPMPNIIINHLCKPNLHLSASEVRGGHPEFVEWKNCVEKMASFSTTYIKLSGLFSELPTQEEGHAADIDELIMHTKPWVDVVFVAFGPSRILFGSDWPVCNFGGPGIAKSWSHWVAFVVSILEDQKLNEQEKARVWAETAVEAYSIPQA